MPAPAGDVRKWTDAIPDPASAELEVTLSAPRTFALAAGTVRAPVGKVLSTRTFVTSAEVNVLPAL